MGIDFIRLFERQRIEQLPDRRRGWANVNCPFCNPKDYHHNGGFHVGKPIFYCWRCGWHPWDEAIAKIFSTDIRSARQLAREYEGLVADTYRKAVAHADVIGMPGGPFNKAEREYLVGRNLKPSEMYRKWGMRGGGIAGEWSYRIIIPIFLDGILISWTARSTLPKDYIRENKIPRYKNLSIERSVINPKDTLFNIDNCTSDTVVLCEGPMDVVRMGDGFACSLGTSFTGSQTLMLTKRFKHVIVAFDNEPEAQKKARRLASNLSLLGVDTEVANICKDFDKNDPGELSEEEVKIVRNEIF